MPRTNPRQVLHQAALPQRRTRVVAVVTCVAALGTLAVSAGTAAGQPGTAPAAAPASKIDKQVQSTSQQLSQAAHAVLDADNALEDAAKDLPVAQAKVTSAQAGVVAAQQAVKDAEAALAAAQAAVAAQQQQVVQVQNQIAGLKVQISSLASQVYKAGGEYQELEILLQSQDPSQFAVQLSSVRRMARGNGYALDRMAAAQHALKLKLQQLQQLQDSAKEKQANADARAKDAQDAHTAAIEAQQSVETIIPKRKLAVKAAAANRRVINATYNRLLAEQQRIAIEQAARDAADGKPFSGNIPPGGSAQAIVAVKFALSQVGHRYVSSGGTGPTYGCNGFSWRSWHEAGSRWPLMLAQDQATSRRWVLPVSSAQAAPGDLIFWRFNNGTDGRPNAIDHVGIVVDPASGLFVEAANTARGVVTDNYKSGHYSHPAAFGRVIA